MNYRKFIPSPSTIQLQESVDLTIQNSIIATQAISLNEQTSKSSFAASSLSLIFGSGNTSTGFATLTGGINNVNNGENCLIYGNNITIDSGCTNVFVMGDNVTVPTGTTGVTALGVNKTAGILKGGLLSKLPLTLNIAGGHPTTPLTDVITLTGQSIPGAATDVLGQFTWREIR